jgi:hypothetical protein
MADLTSLPFFFTYRDNVYGHGFLADVATHGRLLAAKEAADAWWVYGVQPGDVAASGKTLSEAQAEFRKAFTAVLYDIANETKDFPEFKAHVESFVNEVNKPIAEAWDEAVRRVRESGMTAKTESPIEPAESPVTVQVVMKKFQKFTPADNVLDPEPALAA